jgi:hypothetical protein
VDDNGPLDATNNAVDYMIHRRGGHREPVPVEAESLVDGTHPGCRRGPLVKRSSAYIIRNLRALRRLVLRSFKTRPIDRCEAVPKRAPTSCILASQS